LGELDHPRADKLLEKGLKHADDKVRVAAFQGLRKHAGPAELRPLVLALKTDRADIGVLAVEALEPLAAKDDQALAALMEAIESKKLEVRDADLQPLLQGTGSRALDTCLRASRGLAMLHDPRAFGLLLQRSREDNSVARVEVCHALAALEDVRAINPLRSLLFDAEASVRD